MTTNAKQQEDTTGDGAKSCGQHCRAGPTAGVAASRAVRPTHPNRCTSRATGLRSHFSPSPVPCQSLSRVHLTLPLDPWNPRLLLLTPRARLGRPSLRPRSSVPPLQGVLTADSRAEMAKLGCGVQRAGRKGS